MSTEYFDVVIVGAGLSGIGAAYHLQTQCPSKRYIILESREAIGGTWDLFRYPGLRSDSDMYTLGYSFKPWRDHKIIADGPSILQYIEEAAVENKIDQRIRLGHQVTAAAWSSTQARWTVSAQRNDTSQAVQFTCNMLLICSGYYSYESGYTPQFKDQDCFAGKMVHPQDWPEELDYRGKKVVVIGSGATAMTLVPEMAKVAEHVVILQRSPSYVYSSPEQDQLADFLSHLLPEPIVYQLMRWQYISRQQLLYQLNRAQPQLMKQLLIQMVRQELGPDYDIETHFTPRYNPWDQRICVVPNSDLFQAIQARKASVTTDNIEAFTQTGILLKSGKTLDADIIVTATGLNILMLGGIKFVVDHQPVDFPQTYTYKGMMFSDIPNLISVTGYISASWTLHAELTAEYACRLINYMDKNGFHQCRPCLRDEDRNMPTRPWITDFSPGYLQRVMHLLPKQGDREPWLNSQSYWRDQQMLNHGAIDDGVLVFSNSVEGKTPQNHTNPFLRQLCQFWLRLQGSDWHR